MKKLVAVFAVVVLSLGMFSCTSEASQDEDQLYVNSPVACDDCGEVVTKGN
ncbi:MULTISPECIES: hypothetical protein [Cellulophaga]|jgi:hypothetical protein|uniref:Copper chaperone CopZ n=1 Tax=Cellulophaga baltica TaxID=76594 RepID=A0A1G7HI25_9FLAO|nr:MULTISPECIES: hypothetical protein [Cellulophaga]WFO16811.1 hypothetical protein M601_003165 [Cellulophaga baltica 4]MCR1026342.1 hypothetical protein [Cellulophaga baltica]QXP52933.1 hypothetical protein H0I24_03125 [Cellulophaga sp. HaHa_2_1]QXP54794.1 hypothetical protein H0I25_11925 [Cellulophaga sp. HaHa_2_95]SDF00157.1 hypothetical protein SAMN04487992_10694 [Cellulophaga baltica]